MLKEERHHPPAMEMEGAKGHKAREREVEHQKQLRTRSVLYRKRSTREAVDPITGIVKRRLGNASARKAHAPSSSRQGRGGPLQSSHLW